MTLKMKMTLVEEDDVSFKCVTYNDNIIEEKKHQTQDFLRFLINILQP